MGGRLTDWLGFGPYASRPLPAVALANLASGGADGFAQYLSVDTGGIVSFLDPSVPDWIEFNFGSLAGQFQDLSDVDWSTPPTDGQVFKWDNLAGKLVPYTIPANYTTEQLQDLVGAMGVNGTGTTFTYDDTAGTFKFDSTITQYTDELAMDAIAAAFAAGTHTNITITYDDASNKFSFAAASGYSDEQAQDALASAFAAGTHTGLTITYGDGANEFDFALGSIDGHTDVDTTTTPPTDGQGLVWNAAGSVWKPGSVSGSSFQGVICRKSADQTAADFSAAPALTWDAEDVDTGNFHSTSSNTSRITPTAGDTVRFTGGIYTALVNAGIDAMLYIQRTNGATVERIAVSACKQFGYANPGVVVVSRPIVVTSGDYFELCLFVNGDTSITITKIGSWFGMEVLATSSRITMPTAEICIPRIRDGVTDSTFSTGFFGGRSVIIPYDCTIYSIKGVSRSNHPTATIEAVIYDMDAAGNGSTSLLAKSAVITGVTTGVNEWVLQTPLNVTRGQRLAIGVVSQVAAVNWAQNTESSAMYFSVASTAPSTASAFSWGSLGWNPFWLVTT